MWILSACFVLLIVLFKIYHKTVTINKYWSERGIPHIKSWPIIGSMSNLVFDKVPMSQFLWNLYTNSFCGRFLGIYYFSTPCIVMKDLDLIKQITIQHFQAFPAHSAVISESADPLISKTLLFMKGNKKWRRLRSTVSPAFTSSKIKIMFNLMISCASELVTHIEKHNTNRAVDMKNLFSKYATDVIGNCAVGVSCNSFKNPNNDFFRLATDTAKSFKSIKTYVHAIHPSLTQILNLRLLNKKYTDYWLKFSKEIIKTRENGVYRPDMVQLLINVKNGQLINDQPENALENNLYQNEETKDSHYHLTDEDIAAQTLIFLLAGYDTSSTALTFASYELAMNYNVQTKLQNEIDTFLAKCAGNPITYEDLLEMKYIDAVVSETLRKWPPVTYVDRKCYKECVLRSKDNDEKPVKLDPGVLVLIPVLAIHRDPKYYPEPDIFDPERFCDQNKSSIKPFSFLPFGIGPRSCIGSRFALLEVKIMLFHVLAKFDIVPVKETPNPMPVKGKFLLEPEACKLSFKLRKQVSSSKI